jgi:hypothetical protein
MQVAGYILRPFYSLSSSPIIPNLGILILERPSRFIEALQATMNIASHRFRSELA